MNPDGEVELFHPVTKQAVVIPVSLESMRDVDGVRTYVARAVDESFDRYLHPWKYPDRMRWPEFVPLPRLAAFVDRMRERRQRVRDAWSVLLGRDRIYDEDTDSDW